MSSDGQCLSSSPSLPARWKNYQVPVLYRASVLAVRVDRDAATFTIAEGAAILVEVFGRRLRVN